MQSEPPVRVGDRQKIRRPAGTRTDGVSQTVSQSEVRVGINHDLSVGRSAGCRLTTSRQTESLLPGRSIGLVPTLARVGGGWAVLRGAPTKQTRATDRQRPTDRRRQSASTDRQPLTHSSVVRPTTYVRSCSCLEEPSFQTVESLTGRDRTRTSYETPAPSVTHTFRNLQ